MGDAVTLYRPGSHAWISNRRLHVPNQAHAAKHPKHAPSLELFYFGLVINTGTLFLNCEFARVITGTSLDRWSEARADPARQAPIGKEYVMSRKLLAVAVPFAACLAWGHVLAQPMDELVVEASPITKEGKADTASPAPGYYKVMLSSRVSYAGLDLSKPADFAILEGRVTEAAKVVCDKLGKAYPDSGPATKECAKRAADKALTEARQRASSSK